MAIHQIDQHPNSNTEGVGLKGYNVQSMDNLDDLFPARHVKPSDLPGCLQICSDGVVYAGHERLIAAAWQRLLSTHRARAGIVHDNKQPIGLGFSAFITDVFRDQIQAGRAGPHIALRLLQEQEKDFPSILSWSETCDRHHDNGSDGGLNLLVVHFGMTSEDAVAPMGASLLREHQGFNIKWFGKQVFSEEEHKGMAQNFSCKNSCVYHAGPQNYAPVVWVTKRELQKDLQDDARFRWENRTAAHDLLLAGPAKYELDEPYRTLIFCRIMGMSTTETAELLGEKASTVDKWWNRELKKRLLQLGLNSLLTASSDNNRRDQIARFFLDRLTDLRPTRFMGAASWIPQNN